MRSEVVRCLAPDRRRGSREAIQNGSSHACVFAVAAKAVRKLYTRWGSPRDSAGMNFQSRSTTSVIEPSLQPITRKMTESEPSGASSAFIKSRVLDGVLSGGSFLRKAVSESADSL